jgi:EAL domain-containing protein (putative c-di-GMP-specific phosphodiesterase class I)
MEAGDPISTVPLPPDCRIVIVDDVAANVALLERVLRSAGAGRVTGYVDPRAAISACVESCPDVLLLDLHMPYLDGFAVMNELRMLLPADEFLPIVVLTADATSGAKGRALAAGATDFLAKPFDHSEVLLRIRNLVQMRRLYLRAQDQNRLLTAEVEQQRARQRDLAAVRRASVQRVSGVLQRPNSMQMLFQPIAELETHTIVGAEALARFLGEPDQPPDVWFSEAAAVGFGEALELRAIDLALARVADFPDDAFIALNVSPATAARPALRDRVAALPGRRVVLELTEHDEMRDYGALWPALDELRGQGVRIAVDDTGAGYAGLQHILHLQPDIVKLDKDLTRDIDRDPARRALAAALVGFAGDIGATLIAEGIENEAERQVLQELGVPWGQGYHLARPGGLPLALAGARRDQTARRAEPR